MAEILFRATCDCLITYRIAYVVGLCCLNCAGKIVWLCLSASSSLMRKSGTQNYPELLVVLDCVGGTKASRS